MSHVFNLNTTRKQQILVEYLTASGSAFAVTPEGQQVFLNKRLVETMSVAAGDIYNAFLLPNYPDKRDQIPWRAMRVEPADVKLDLAHVSMDSDIQSIIEFMKTFEQGSMFTPEEIAEELKIPLPEVEKLCKQHNDTFTPHQCYSLHPSYK